MATFRITPKMTLPLDGGMKMEKTCPPIDIPVPFGTRPFESVANKERVKSILSLHGYDFSGHESYLSPAFFDVKQI